MQIKHSLANKLSMRILFCIIPTVLIFLPVSGIPDISDNEFAEFEVSDEPNTSPENYPQQSVNYFKPEKEKAHQDNEGIISNHDGKAKNTVKDQVTFLFAQDINAKGILYIIAHQN